MKFYCISLCLLDLSSQLFDMCTLLGVKILLYLIVITVLSCVSSLGGLLW